MKNLTFSFLVLLIAGCARTPLVAPMVAVPQSGVMAQAKAAPLAKAQSRTSDGIIESMRVMAKRQLILQDTNKDGLVARSEWYGWDRDFDLADRNRDNKVTLAEYEALMTSQLSIDTFRGIAYREFRELDKNADERVIATEWQASYRTFHDGSDFAKLPWQQFDRNTDQKLDMTEFEDAFIYHWARHD
ncbi:MAG: hypothetical protein H7338_06910 [Candidatus Sericytochromatia bacterium]|nr:hypothetical protein [Candidatus Sericytochromatia bacterium]